MVTCHTPLPVVSFPIQHRFLTSIALSVYKLASEKGGLVYAARLPVCCLFATCPDMCNDKASTTANCILTLQHLIPTWPKYP